MAGRSPRLRDTCATGAVLGSVLGAVVANFGMPAILVSPLVLTVPGAVEAALTAALFALFGAPIGALVGVFSAALTWGLVAVLMSTPMVRRLLQSAAAPLGVRLVIGGAVAALAATVLLGVLWGRPSDLADEWTVAILLSMVVGAAATSVSPRRPPRDRRRRASTATHQ